MASELIEAIRSRRAVLFVGSGVSVGLGLPEWRSLLRHMAQDLGLDMEEQVAAGVSYLALAEYFRLRHGSIGPLRSWMDRNFSASVDRIKSSRVHELIVSLDFPIVYTTNFDRNLEEAYRLHGREFTKIATAKDMARTTEPRPQIVKFHGDFDDDQSLVLTETAYFDRLNFESPLDIKLRADALSRTILFIGYSLSDVNIRFLLHKLWRTWRISGQESARPKSYVFMIAPNQVQRAVLAQWGIEMLEEAGADPGNALQLFLERLAEAVAADR